MKSRPKFDTSNALRDIYLYGNLGRIFGKHHRLAVKTGSEAIRAMMFQLQGFREVVEAGVWKVMRGHPTKGFCLDQDTLGLNVGTQPLHIIPAPQGAGGGGGAGKVIIGVVLIAVAVVAMQPEVLGLDAGALSVGTATGFATSIGGVITAGQLAGIGAALLLGGIAALISPSKKGNNPNAGQSYLFTGAVNTNQEGVCIPLVYGGPIMVGSIQGAAIITTQDQGQNSPIFASKYPVNGKLYSFAKDNTGIPLPKDVKTISAFQ